jgi:Zn-dependent peptidase ImmA (M78 family)
LRETANELKHRLIRVGLSYAAINAAWPVWWSEAADASPSAKAELRFSLARKLGLDPHSLLEEDGEPRFVWRDDEARFKHLSGESEHERSAITSFGTALGSVLIAATAASEILDLQAGKLRDSILSVKPVVGLRELLALSWGIGIPVVHLRVFPRPTKKMAAMCVRVGSRSAILLGKDSMFPPHIAFYLAHELGHIILGHLREHPVMVDLENQDRLPSVESDSDEAAADAFALELLTGESRPEVLPLNDGTTGTGKSLAAAAMIAGAELRIEAGTLALCFGFSTGQWRTANAAMRHIYAAPTDVWTEVNKIAMNQLSMETFSEDMRPYVRAILGS